jgi:hypothetical protein
MTEDLIEWLAAFPWDQVWFAIADPRRSPPAPHSKVRYVEQAGRMRAYQQA